MMRWSERGALIQTVLRIIDPFDTNPNLGAERLRLESLPDNELRAHWTRVTANRAEIFQQRVMDKVLLPSLQKPVSISQSIVHPPHTSKSPPVHGDVAEQLLDSPRRPSRMDDVGLIIWRIFEHYNYSQDNAALWMEFRRQAESTPPPPPLLGFKDGYVLFEPSGEKRRGKMNRASFDKRLARIREKFVSD